MNFNIEKIMEIYDGGNSRENQGKVVWVLSDLLQIAPLRRTRKKGIVKRESGHRRIVVEIENGKTFAIPFHYEKTE